MQLKLFVFTGESGWAPEFISQNEVWLKAAEDMFFFPFQDCEYLLDHEVYIPSGVVASVSTFVNGLYVDIQYQENVISSIKYKMYEWGQETIRVSRGQPIIKIKLTSLSAE